MFIRQSDYLNRYIFTVIFHVKNIAICVCGGCKHYCTYLRLQYVLVAKAFCEQKLILPAVFATPRLGVAITLVPKHNNIVPPKSTILWEWRWVGEDGLCIGSPKKIKITKKLHLFISRPLGN